MILIFSAPSGSGKSTLVQYLLDTRQDIVLSISATTRAPRGQEQDGREYYFITPERFEQLIKEDAFVEWQQVYKGTYYGTLRSEIERIENAGHHVVFDIDVKGGINVKRMFGDRARAIFISPPSIEALRERLTKPCACDIYLTTLDRGITRTSDQARNRLAGEDRGASGKSRD